MATAPCLPPRLGLFHLAPLSTLFLFLSPRVLLFSPEGFPDALVPLRNVLPELLPRDVVAVLLATVRRSFATCKVARVQSHEGRKSLSLGSVAITVHLN
jgi:hypothetical protein